MKRRSEITKRKAMALVMAWRRRAATVVMVIGNEYGHVQANETGDYLLKN